MSTDDLTITDALRIADQDRDQLLERLQVGPHDEVTTSGRIIHGPSLWPTTHEPKRERLFRWSWKVSDHTTERVLDNGWSFTERWARHRAGTAARRIYAERAAKRKADAERKAAGGGDQ